MVRLGDVCEEIKDRIQSSKISVDEYVTTDNMVKDRGGIVQAEYVPSEVGLVEYHKGDVLIANIRPYLKKIWLADHDGGCSSDVVVFRSNADGLSSEYLYSVLSQDVYFEYVMQKPRGTKMPRGDRDWMKEFRFPLPPLSEQKEIVARLERELAAVEKMKKGFEALAETARAEFKAELKEVFEEISRGGAETRRLGDVLDTGAGGTPLKQHRDYYDGGNIPWLRSGEVCKKDITETELFITVSGMENSSAKLFPRDSVVVAMYGATAGQVGILRIESTTNQAVCAIFPSSKHVPEFLYYQLLGKKEEMVSQAQGGAQPNISQIKIKNLRVCLPPLAVQREVVARLDSAKARAEKLEAKAREGVAVCETMRKAILKEAFDDGRASPAIGKATGR